MVFSSKNSSLAIFDPERMSKQHNHSLLSGTLKIKNVNRLLNINLTQQELGAKVLEEVILFDLKGLLRKVTSKLGFGKLKWKSSLTIKMSHIKPTSRVVVDRTVGNEKETLKRKYSWKEACSLMFFNVTSIRFFTLLIFLPLTLADHDRHVFLNWFVFQIAFRFELLLVSFIISLNANRSA